MTLLQTLVVIAVVVSPILVLCEVTGPPDFFELKKFAYLASVSYCIKKGLHTGTVGTQGPSCPSVACLNEHIAPLEIIKIFEFDGFFEVGSGLIALDVWLKTIYVSFRGTSSTQDWFNNLDALQVSYQPLVQTDEDFKVVVPQVCSKCKVHKGMHSFLKMNAKKFIQHIISTKRERPDYRIAITGHSLGAAISLLVGVELRLLGYDALVVALASPKVGNKAFARFVDDLLETKDAVRHIDTKKSFESLDRGYVRMNHKNDIVPYLPPTSFYAHAGYQYYLSKEGLDQAPDTIVRRGTKYLEDEPIDLLEAISNSRRLDHSSYFVAVSHCI